MPISSKVEAARIPQQLLGELFVEKGLITPEELAQALAQQQTSDKRIGQILVEMGLVSRPDLGTMLAEQLGVELAKQEGFGAGLWSEIKRRHPRGRPDIEDNEAPELVGPLVEQELPLAAIDEPDVGGEAEPDELESFRQQLAFASTRLEEERTAHQGTQRLLEETRGELASRAEEIDDWRERAMRAEDSPENTKAAADLAELEATAAELRAELVAREQELAERIASEALVQSLSEQVEVLRVKSDEAWGLLEGAHTEARALDGTVTALRAELEAREGELAAGVEVRSQLAAEAGRLEDELNALRDQHSGSKDAVAALTAQVDELRAGGAEALRFVDEARAEAAALDATVAELRSELDKARDEGSQSHAAVTTLKEQLDIERASREELERKLLEARAEAAAFEATAGELREELSSRGDADVLEEQLTTVREEMARLEQVADKRKAKANELAQELRAAQDNAAGLTQLIAEHEQALARESESREALEAEAAELRRELPKAERARTGADGRPRGDGPPRTGLRAAEGEGEGAPGAGRGRAGAVRRRDGRARAGAEELPGREIAVGAAGRRAASRCSCPRGRVAHGPQVRPRLVEPLRVEAAESRRARAGARDRSRGDGSPGTGFRAGEDEVNELHGLLRASGNEPPPRAITRMSWPPPRTGRQAWSSWSHNASAPWPSEAEARAAVEAQLASLGASAEALDQRLQEECAAHVATRRELGRMEAELASLQPLTDKLAATETELAACAKLLEEVSAGLDSARERAERNYDSDRHVVLMPLEGVYSLAERPGPTPDVGTYEDVDGARFLVARIGRSPLPADNRRCAFLEVA